MPLSFAGWSLNIPGREAGRQGIIIHLIGGNPSQWRDLSGSESSHERSEGLPALVFSY